MVADDGADIIWDRPRRAQSEIFMHRLEPHLNRGVMIAVGAAFKFFSGRDVRRPEWMVRHHLEFLHLAVKLRSRRPGRCGTSFESALALHPLKYAGTPTASVDWRTPANRLHLHVALR